MHHDPVCIVWKLVYKALEDKEISYLLTLISYKFETANFNNFRHNQNKLLSVYLH